MSTLVSRLGNLSAAILSDCLRGSHTLSPAIRGMTQGVGLAGPAFTVLAEAGSIITVHKALLEAPAGAVLVVGGETGLGVNGAMFGKLMTIQSMLHRIAGVIVDGPVRDVADIRELGFPVFARSTTPRVGVNRTVGRTQVPTPCGGIIVNPGDYVRADDDGVMVIPPELLEEVVMAAEARLQKEAELETQMRDGAHIADLIGLRKLIDDAK